MFDKSAGIVNQKWIARIVLVAFAFCTFPIPTPVSRIPVLPGENSGSGENCSGRQCQCATKGTGEACCCYGNVQQSKPESSDVEFAPDGHCDARSFYHADPMILGMHWRLAHDCGEHQRQAHGLSRDQGVLKAEEWMIEEWRERPTEMVDCTRKKYAEAERWQELYDAAGLP